MAASTPPASPVKTTLTPPASPIKPVASPTKPAASPIKSKPAAPQRRQRWRKTRGVRRLGFLGLLLLCLFANRAAISQRIWPTEPPTHTWPTKRISVFVLMGKTGAGKSSFIKLLNGADPLGGQPIVDHGINSCTQRPAIYLTRVDKQKVLLLDTPGFDDSARDNLEVLNEIMSHLYSLALQPEDFAMRGVVFLHDISETRFGGSQKKTLGILKALLGDANLGNVVVGTTMWDAKRYKQQEQRERALQDEQWRGIHKTMRLPHGDKRATENIIRELLKREPALLLAQEEMLKPPHTVESTTVGRLAMPEGRLELKNLQREQKEQERAFEAETKRQEALLQKQIQDTKRRFEDHEAQNQEREERQKIKQRVELRELEEKLRQEFDKGNKKWEAEAKENARKREEEEQEAVRKQEADLEEKHQQRIKVWEEQMRKHAEEAERLRKALEELQKPPKLTWFQKIFRAIARWFKNFG